MASIIDARESFVFGSRPYPTRFSTCSKHFDSAAIALRIILPSEPALLALERLDSGSKDDGSSEIMDGQTESHL